MPRALIVDDSRYQRHLIITALSGLFACDEAANGREAVDQFTAAMSGGVPYDLVVMDILMPVLSGHEALLAIRRLEEDAGVVDDRRTPAIMLSSLDDPGNMLRAQFESGAQAYVTKPFSSRNLLEALSSLGLTDSPLSEELETPCKPF